jgi:DNA-binding beta-propeller fold protein YncE
MKFTSPFAAVIAVLLGGLAPAFVTVPAGAAPASPGGSTAGEVSPARHGALAGRSQVSEPPATRAARLWAARYGSTAGDSGADSVAVSPDGSAVFVTGLSAKVRGGLYDYATVAYNAATGARLWAARYGVAAGSSRAAAVAVSPDGSAVFVTGTSTTPGSSDYATVAYNAATGARLWAARYSGPVMDSSAAAVAVSPDGSAVFVTGGSGTANLPFVSAQYATVAYKAATGARLWAARFGPSAGSSAANSVAVSPDGSAVLVTGFSPPAAGGFSDYATVAYRAATGARLWAARYHGRAGRAAPRRWR